MTETKAAANDLAPPSVLVIEAAETGGPSIVEALACSRMPIIHAIAASSGLSIERSKRPDIVVIDLELPNTDGLTLVRQMRRQSQCGMILVSSQCEPEDRVIGLELGADHYLCKPPRPRELIARIRAVSRRIKAAPLTPSAALQTAQLGKITLDIPSRSLQSDDGDRIPLTAAEFGALGAMLAASGTVVSRQKLSEAALHRGWRYDNRSVDQLIFSLRQKLAHADDRSLIQSVRGAGYLLAVSA